jgi:hypothetical protein
VRTDPPAGNRLFASRSPGISSNGRVSAVARLMLGAQETPPLRRSTISSRKHVRHWPRLPVPRAGPLLEMTVGNLHGWTIHDQPFDLLSTAGLAVTVDRRIPAGRPAPATRVGRREAR